jgi:hypothetical protein
MSADILKFVIELVSWQSVSSFLNSNFTAALAGALAGALAAQKIGDRAKQQDRLVKEIRITNATITIAFTICNSGIALKKQFVKDIFETYTAKKAELEEFQRRSAAGQPSAIPFTFQADLRTLQMPAVPIDMLRTQVYESISATGRPLALVAALVGAVASLADTIHKRNSLIERFQREGTTNRDQVTAFYFGLPYGSGHVSTEFCDLVEALHSLTDDVIFFSELLVKDLTAHGNCLLDQYKSISNVKKEKIFSVDFTDPFKQGLMPDEANYNDWLKGFPGVTR